MIIRISMVIDGPIPKPTDEERNYTGSEIVVCDSIPGVYTVTDEYKATDVREEPYEYTVTLADGLKWSDGDDQPVTVHWKIVPGSVTIPTPDFTSVPYDEKNHVVTALPPEAKFKFTEASTTAATAVDDYSYTAQLLDSVNWRWSDGSITNQTFQWSITPRQIAPQPLPTGLVYAGTNNVAVTNNPNYVFAEGSVTSATNAGTYQVIFELADPANNRWPDGSVTNLTYCWEIARMPVDKPPVPGDNGVFVYDGKDKVAATNSIYYTFAEGSTIKARKADSYYFDTFLEPNYCWRGESGEAAVAPYLVKWRINQAPNKITSLSQGDWKLGEQPKKPSVTADFGANTAQYTYGKSPTGPWAAAAPETNGVFYVRAFIPATTDWASAERTKRFLVYKSFDELFTDYVDITPDYSGDILSNQPVLVKLSEALYPGFTYARCGGSDNLAFMSDPGTANETPLSYEVDTWNEKGESYVWVKVPRLAAGKTFRMYWHLRDGLVGPGPDAGEVWRDYVGVWHFGETISTSTAASSTPSRDSTDNGYDALPNRGKSGSASQMKSDVGVIGNARVNATATKQTSGNHLVVSNFMNCALGSSFVFSGWVNLSFSEGAPWIFARKDGGATGGFALALNGTNRAKFDLYGGGTTATTTQPIAGGDIKGNWVNVTLAVNGSDYWVYTQSPTLGNYSVSGQLTAPAGEEGLPLAFGSDPTGGVSSVNGKFDEFRLRKWNPATETTAAVFAAARATYTNTVAASTFLPHGWVVKDGQNQNYWLERPDILKNGASVRRWEQGDATVAHTLGKAAIGEVAVVFRNLYKPEETSPTLPTKAGNYVATFTVAVDGFDPLVEEINFTIVGHQPYSELGVTEEGRILLANDDSRGDWGDTSITNQAYWLKPYDEIYRSTIITNSHKEGPFIVIDSIVTNT